VQLVGSLRCSDSDREQVAERLRQAMAEGRLSEDEFEQRLQALLAARTYVNSTHSSPTSRSITLRDGRSSGSGA
jgi:Domain of unknown function (DUF1707)